MKNRLEHCGILGGTFDPIHAGHLAMAAAAARACHLQHIFFVPAPNPVHRAAPVASFADRFAMVALALARRPYWLPLAVPDRAPHPTYALDQVGWIEQWLAARGRRARLYWILGADAFITLPSWHCYRDFLQRCDFVVLARDGIGQEAVFSTVPGDLVMATTARSLRLAGGRQLHWLPRFSSPASSTRLRARLAQASQTKAPPLPAAVARYAQRAGLYAHAQEF